MCEILLSIHPQHVNNILCGTKKYEYRKIACKRHVDKIVIYSTTPIKKVVGEAEVLEVLEKDKEELWNETKDSSGISKQFFLQYYEGRKKAVAYKLGKVVKYSEPKELSDYGIQAAPQSFAYIVEEQH